MKFDLTDAPAEFLAGTTCPSQSQALWSHSANPILQQSCEWDTATSDRNFCDNILYYIIRQPIHMDYRTQQLILYHGPDIRLYSQLASYYSVVDACTVSAMPYGYTLHGRVQYIYIASYREWQAYNFVRTVYMVEVSVPPLPKTPFLTRESPSLTHVAIQFNEL